MWRPLQVECLWPVVTNSRPVIVTYHDLGLNYVSNFQAFFNYPEVIKGSPEAVLLIKCLSGDHLLVPNVSHQCEGAEIKLIQPNQIVTT